MAGITKEIDAYVIKYRSSENGNDVSPEILLLKDR